MYRTKIIKNKNTKLVAGFMGLMDLEKKTNFIFRKLIHEIITYSLKNLDYIFFFSPVDREESCKKYKININKTFLFPFGIDYEFWKNEKFNQRKSFILSVGSDSNRDYNTINKLSINENILILSNLKLSYINNKNIKIINGNYAKNNVSDLELKNYIQTQDF